MNTFCYGDQIAKEICYWYYKDKGFKNLILTDKSSKNFCKEPINSICKEESDRVDIHLFLEKSNHITQSINNYFYSCGTTLADEVCLYSLLIGRNRFHDNNFDMDMMSGASMVSELFAVFDEIIFCSFSPYLSLYYKDSLDMWDKKNSTYMDWTDVFILTIKNKLSILKLSKEQVEFYLMNRSLMHFQDIRKRFFINYPLEVEHYNGDKK